jgi:hypothetical protein
VEKQTDFLNMAYLSVPKDASYIAMMNIYLGSIYDLFKDYFRGLGYRIG